MCNSRPVDETGVGAVNILIPAVTRAGREEEGGGVLAGSAASLYFSLTQARSNKFVTPMPICSCRHFSSAPCHLPGGAIRVSGSWASIALCVLGNKTGKCSYLGASCPAVYVLLGLRITPEVPEPAQDTRRARSFFVLLVHIVSSVLR